MQGKLERANHVVARVVLQVVEIVDVVDLDLVVFSLFEMILNVKGLDPLWVQVVHDDLGLSDLVPHASTQKVSH